MAVLALLAEGDMHGYQIIQEMAGRTRGTWSPSPGSVYPTLQQLEAKGFVSSKISGDKRVFSLTELGRKHATSLPNDGPWDELTPSDQHGELRDSVSTLLEAVHQIARAGSPAQISRACTLVTDLRRGLYRILAED
jgi:DNA-binding PadR family transcriptional regulator